MERSSAILMAVSSLPSPYGIGTLGQAAKDYIDFLSKSGQSYWQVLPLGTTSFGDSPYTNFSAFAGNPYYIDLDILINDGLLKKDEVLSCDWGSDPGHVDYDKLFKSRFKVLRYAYERGFERDKKDVMAFLADNEQWVKNYALYMAVKKHFDMKPWSEWPDESIRKREPQSIVQYSELLADDICFYEYLQFLFFKQWQSLHQYAVSKGIHIIGDIPIYIALDSADVWSEPECFELDPDGYPRRVSGVPPDFFSKDGQLWGNPLYDWDIMKKTGYDWWIRRIGGAAKLYDVIRIDHFRGLESFWAVPYGEKTARNGEWVKGPANDLVDALKNAFPDLSFIAEDLGFLTDEVKDLLAYSKWPGMKVLQFAFDSREPSNYLPHNYTSNCVCYTGTHDNTTLKGWLDDASAEDVVFAQKYLGVKSKEEICSGVIRAGMASVADLFVAPMQDYLGLGKEARMNVPGTVGGNWVWRMRPGTDLSSLAESISEITKLYGRDRNNV